ncbi:MAG: M14 family zinc carboxypeptidase [Fimbriimonadaceae bacterium]
MNWALALLLGLSAPTSGIDEAYSAKIKEYTTEPFFLTDWVDTLPAGNGVPTPMDVLGHIVGAPGHLTYSHTIYEYMRRLDAASPRVLYEKIGTSEEGKDIVVVYVSSEANIRNLARLKEVNAKLGDPRKTSEDEAKALIAEARPFYWFTGGMHAPEAGPPEMLMELAYRLAVSDDPRIEHIRNGTVTMITPILDVDGRDRVVDIYRYKKTNPDKPEIPLVYWGKYVAHDDNRDGMLLSLELSKAVTRRWLQDKPLVFHDLHQSVPFLYVSTGTGPYNPWLDPIVIDEWHELAYNEVGQMTAMGVPGVWTHGFYDGWAANYGFTVAHGHNGIGRFYETFGDSGADTSIRTVGANSTSRQWYRPNPPFPRVNWSIRNNTNLMQTGVLIGLHKMASDREKFMKNFWLKSKRSVAKATTEGPAAYVFPADDPNEGNQALLIAALRQQGIEVDVMAEEVGVDGMKVGGRAFFRTSYIVKMNQPYSRLADMLLDRQYYNPDDPRSYDDTGWQLGPLFNAVVHRIKDPKVLDVKVSTGGVAAGSDNRMYSGYEENGRTHIFVSEPRSDVVASAGHLKAAKTRIALVHTWQSTQDEGWARIALDQNKIKYDYISVHEIRDTADLKAKYDVILMPQARGTAQSIVAGRPKTGEPIPWKQTPQTPNLGGPDSTDDIRGGLELEGVLNLRNFVQEGGLLVCIGNMVRVPIDFGIVSGVSVRTPNEINAPGGVFLTENNAKDSKVTQGYGDTLSVYFNSNSLPILTTGGGGPGGGGANTTRPSGRGDLGDPDVVQGRAAYDPGRPETQRNQGPQSPQPRVLLRYAQEDKLLVAGMLVGGNELARQAALVQCPVGKGNVLLFSFNPFWRGQTVGSYALFFNAATNWDKMSAAPED